MHGVPAMNTHGTRWLAPLVLIASLGCNDDPAPVSVQEYGAEGSRWLCARLFDCCDADSRPAFFGAASPPPSTTEECIAYFDASLGPVFDTLATSIDAGRVDYDGALAASCLEGFAEQSCQDFRAMVTGSVLVAQCDGVLRGRVADGGACSTLFDCESRSCTAINADSLGTCRAIAGEGEACGASAVCATGFFCDVLAEAPVCTRSRVDGAECRISLECASFSCVDGECAPRAPLCSE